MGFKQGEPREQELHSLAHLFIQQHPGTCQARPRAGNGGLRRESHTGPELSPVRKKDYEKRESPHVARAVTERGDRKKYLR